MSDLQGYTLEEAAIMLRRSTRTLQRMIGNGKLKICRIGVRGVVVPSSEITRLLTPAGDSVDVSSGRPAGKVKLYQRVSA